MPKAIWKNTILAESEQTTVVEGNHYFPPNALERRCLRENNAHTECEWKGTASYYDVVVDGQVNEQAAWYCPDPKPAGQYLQDYVAFWKCVHVE